MHCACFNPIIRGGLDGETAVVLHTSGAPGLFGDPELEGTL